MNPTAMPLRIASFWANRSGTVSWVVTDKHAVAARSTNQTAAVPGIYQTVDSYLLHTQRFRQFRQRMFGMHGEVELTAPHRHITHIHFMGGRPTATDHQISPFVVQSVQVPLYTSRMMRTRVPLFS